jgi:N-acylglucosamine 2-epimerase
VPEALLAKYRDELTQRVLPFWLQHALDRSCGGYYNCLDAQGQVYDTRKHVWMQGRGAWMFARLYNTFDPRPEYKQAATLIFDFLAANARRDEFRCWHTLSRSGQPVFFQRKPYSAFFVSLALAEYAKISGNPAHRDEAIGLFWDMKAWIANPALLGRPALAGAPSYTQLADLYVLGWLAFELDQIHTDPAYGVVIQDCLQRLKAHYDPRLNLFRENAGAPAELPEARLVCTGSSLEVSWLFLHMLEKYPDPEIEQLLLDAILGALEYGWDREYGGLYYLQDAEGRPPVALESNMKLWWSHTEAIYAAALAYKKTSDTRYLEWWRRVDEYAFRTFADPQHGEWFGYCDRRGQVATPLKGGPYKGIFHVPRALLFTLQAYS